MVILYGLTNAENFAQFCPGAILTQRAQDHHGWRHHRKFIVSKTFERELWRNPQTFGNLLGDGQRSLVSRQSRDVKARIESDPVVFWGDAMKKIDETAQVTIDVLSGQ